MYIDGDVADIGKGGGITYSYGTLSPFLYDNDDDVAWFMDSDGFIDVDGNDWFWSKYR